MSQPTVLALSLKPTDKSVGFLLCELSIGYLLKGVFKQENEVKQRKNSLGLRIDFVKQALEVVFDSLQINMFKEESDETGA